MSPKQKVSFFSKGKKVFFEVATKGARRASAAAQKQVGYKPTPAQRKAAAARAEKRRYKPYKRTAENFYCPIGSCKGRFRSKSALVQHIKTIHPKEAKRILYLRAKIPKATPAQRKAAAARNAKGQYKPYKPTPAQRKKSK